MKNIYLVFRLFLLFCLLEWQGGASVAVAQCILPEVQLIVEIVPDEWAAAETSWLLSDANGMTIDSLGAIGDTLCISQTACLRFTIFDQEFNGLQNGAYCRVWYDGQEVFFADQFGVSQYTIFGGCALGYSCHFATPAEIGDVYNAALGDTWFSFVPEQTGTYTFSTCHPETPLCDTQIWLYDHCQNLSITEGAEGASAFSTQGCGQQAKLTVVLTAGTTYYVRIGDQDGACGSQTIKWFVTFEGAVTGCTDPNACNYNPIATVENNSTCLYPGDPNCLQGPDLVVVREDIINSLYLDHIDNTDPCFIVEGCLKGYGMREIVRFDTRIANIGDRDYTIGFTPFNQNANSSQFEWDPCHDHWHYEGYAEYLLYDNLGQPIPVGFKNGFCVLDLDCPPGVFGWHSCFYMGIAAGCADIYEASLDCQWIDITDMPAGDYMLVVRVNWDNGADNDGYYELNHFNNWAQVCLHIERDSLTNAASVIIDEACEPYVDCLGQLYGNAVIDCNGVCNGGAVAGDFDQNGVLQTNDVLEYANAIVGQTTPLVPCNDVTDDGVVDVADAAAVNACVLQTAGTHTHGSGGLSHNHCQLPQPSITNPNDTVHLSLGEVNSTQQFFDIYIQNPQCYVVNYQLQLSGLQVLNTESLIEQEGYSADLFWNAAGTVLNLSATESRIDRYNAPSPLLRVYYSSITAPEVCVNALAFLNDNYEKAVVMVEPACFAAAILDNPFPANAMNSRVQVIPNPFSESALLLFDNPKHDHYSLELYDPNGTMVWQQKSIPTNSLRIDLSKLPSGIYFYKLNNEKGVMNGKMMKQ